MKIALLGYGKMGKVIEQVALQRGHSIVLKTNRNTTEINLSEADVSIDFSLPSVAVKNISTSIQQNTPIISGTTGWLNQYQEILDLCEKENGAFIYGSNFSLGVNIFFELNKKLSKMMHQFNQYNIDIEEIHHTKKLDAPSGTAISLANDILNDSEKNGWTLSPETSENKIEITAKRIENVPGTHTVKYSNTVDSIEIKHTAHNRDGFALGAVIAAEWIIGKKGVFSMKDVLDL